MKVRFRIFMVMLSVCSQLEVFYSNWLSQAVTFLYQWGKFCLWQEDASKSSKNFIGIGCLPCPKNSAGYFHTSYLIFTKIQSKLMEKLKAKCKCMLTLMMYGAGSWQSCHCLSLVFSSLPFSALFPKFLLHEYLLYRRYMVLAFCMFLKI